MLKWLRAVLGRRSSTGEEGERIAAAHLRRCGYRTCSIGKNHLFPMENCDLYANEPLYRQIGFDHIEDLSGTWGIIEGRSIYTDHLKKLGLLDGVRQYLGELEGKPDQVVKRGLGGA